MSLTKVSYSLIDGAAVNILDFGADPTGMTDSVDAIQAAIDYASPRFLSVYIPDGTFLLDKITFIDPTGIYATRGLNVFGLLFAKSDVTIFGNGKNSVLKVADDQLLKSFVYVANVNSGTYLNHQMPGTKGFQVFAQNPADAAVNNFYMRDFTIDMNGYNNKVFPINSFGNQSQCMAVYITQGGNFVCENVRFVDAPGSQVVVLERNTTYATVKNNVFVNCGFLDGTNVHLDDHSTIYSTGSNIQIVGNRLTQDVQWTGKGGTPIEVHGLNATVVSNYIYKYLSMGVISSIIFDGSFNIENNIGRSITALGYDIYNQNNYAMNCVIKNNDVELTSVALDPAHPGYQFRSFIVTPFFDFSPGVTDLDVEGNRVAMTGTPAWTDTEEQYNAAFTLKLVTRTKIRNNTFQGFRGPIMRLWEQQASSSILFESNCVTSCGRKNNFVTENALVNYTNQFNTSYGNTLFALYMKNNVYSSCVYATYLSLTGVVLGAYVAPTLIQIDGDVTDEWFSTAIGTATFDLPLAFNNYRYTFNYSCTKEMDAPQQLKVLPTSATSLTETQLGIIGCQTALGSVPGQFEKIQGVRHWSYASYKFGDTAPLAAEISPFGAQIGDTMKVVNAAAGGNAGYYCVTAGTPGTWKAYGAIAL